MCESARETRLLHIPLRRHSGLNLAALICCCWNILMLDVEHGNHSSVGTGQSGRPVKQQRRWEMLMPLFLMRARD